MFPNIVNFRRPVNGVLVEQRSDNGFTNATAMCSAHDKDAADWFVNKATFELLNALARRLGKPTYTYEEVKDQNSGDLSVTRLSRLFPDLIIVKRGSPATGGGTWIHPKLAVHIAQWCNPDFALLVSDWIEEWLTTGRNPIDPDFDQQYKQWEQRADIRKYLKDFLRPELMNVVVVWAENHGVSPITLCSKVHDAMNERIQGAKAQQIRAMGGLPLGVLLRDYFEASPLVDYSAINKLAVNDIQDQGVEPVQAVHNACDRYLGKAYAPKLLPIVESVHSQGRRLKAIRQSRQLTAGHQLTLWESDAAS